MEPDLFDDIFADNATKNNTRAKPKFQPKARRGPTRKESTGLSSSSLQSVQAGNSAKNESSIALQPEKPSEPYDERHLESVTHVECAANKESLDHSVSVPPESDVLTTEWRSFSEKPVGENADLFLGLESFESSPPPSTTAMESSVPPSADRSAVPAIQNDKDILASPAVSHVADSGCVSNTADDPTYPEFSPTQDPLTCGQSIVSIDEGGCHTHDGRLESKLIESCPCVESLDISHLTSTSGPRTGKFHTKPKIRKHKDISNTAEHDAGQSIIDLLDEHLDPSRIECMNNGPVSPSGSNDALDLSSLGLDNSIPIDPASEQPADEQPRSLIEASQAETAIHEEHVVAFPETRENLTTLRAEAGKLRPQRKRTNGSQLVDEPENEETDEFSADCLGSLPNEANNEHFQVENESQAKKQQRKSKKSIDEKEKPARKRKKAGEAPDQATATVPKKFSHSTKQKRRRVDKMLLETPEDELDFQKVPLRDLIILADYRERTSKKEAAKLEAYLKSQSVGTTSNGNNDEAFGSEQGEEADDGQANPGVREDAGYFNYQTYMDKTPRVKWSKQDTELFYEGMRQFGSDLSMIQQLFPGRTRRQIKLKFKKEERQQPLMLREALTNRADDHSHFEQVIKHLKQIAAENKQNAYEDESISLVDEEDEEAEQAPEINEETTKYEHQTEPRNIKNLEPDIAVQSPMKSDDDECDIFDWSAYKSEA